MKTIFKTLKQKLKLGLKPLEEAVKLPNASTLGWLTSVEVEALRLAEPGLALYPLAEYRGIISGNFNYKKEIPKMLKVLSFKEYYICDKYVCSEQLEKHFLEKGFIEESEIQKYASKRNDGNGNWKYQIDTETIPAIFIIAPIEMRELEIQKKIRIEKEKIEAEERAKKWKEWIEKDPIILIKHGDWYEPVHAWNHSKAMVEKLIANN